MIQCMHSGSCLQIAETLVGKSRPYQFELQLHGHRECFTIGTTMLSFCGKQMRNSFSTSNEDGEELSQIPELSDHSVLMYPDGILSSIGMLRANRINLNKDSFTDLMAHRVIARRRLIENGRTELQADIDLVWRASSFEDIKDPDAKTLILSARRL